MKKRLVYLVILIGILFVGVSSFYFARNIESIALTIAENEVIYLNTGGQYPLPLEHKNEHKDTLPVVVVANEELVTYNEDERVFYVNNLNKGGSTVVTVSTTNAKLPTYTFSIRVGNGSVQNPYVIKTAVELARIGVDSKWTVSSSYILDGNLDMNVLSGNWTPIGTESVPFTGLFDGNFKTISNLSIVDATSDYAGLFGVIAGSGKVEFLKMKNTHITGEFKAVGAVAGLVKGGSVSKSEIFSDVVTAEINNSRADGVTGGVVGLAEFYDDIKPALFSVSAKDMTIKGNTVGGVLGKGVGAMVYDAFSASNKFSSQALQPIIGGVAGELVSATSTTSVVKNSIIKNTYSSSVYTRAEFAPAIQGNPPTLQNISFVAGVLGKHQGTEQFIIGNYFLTEKGFTKAVGNLENLTVFNAAPLSAEQMQEQTSFLSYEGDNPPASAENAVAWNFDSVWAMEQIFPTLNYESESARPTVYELGDIITTEQQLRAIALHPNNDYVLGADIELTSDWAPIANFGGSLTGRNGTEGERFTISNLVLSGTGYNGMFQTLRSSAKISDIIISGVEITSGSIVGVVAAINQGTVSKISISGLVANNGTNGGDQFGGIVGQNQGFIDNCALEPSNTITLTDMKYVGGVSAVNYGTITNTTVSAQIVMSNPTENLQFGGIAGTQGRASALISNCAFSIGKLEANSNKIVRAGGIVGYNSEGSIKKSYISAHNITTSSNSSSYSGGIVGLHFGGLVEACYAYGDVENFNAGGIIGKTHANVRQSYFNGNVNGRIIGGLTADIRGNVSIINSYAVGALNGLSDAGIVAGYAPYIENGAVIEHCFISVQYNGFGEKWQETKSAIGLVDNPFWVNPAGYIRNSIFNTNHAANAQDQTRFLLWPPFNRAGTNKIDGTNNIICLGEADDFKAFKTTAGFDTSVWRFVQGYFPELKICDFGEIEQPSQFVEEEEDLLDF